MAYSEWSISGPRDSPHTPHIRDTVGNYAVDSERIRVVIQRSNEAPAFPSSETGARSVAENSAGGVNIGAPVAATDAENDRLTYSLGGTDANSFDIVSSSGQIRTKSGVTYDHETKPSHSVTVSVHDGKDIDGNADTMIDDTIAVTITVTDVNEPPVVAGPTTVENYTEGSTGDVASYTADDSENNTIIWSLAGTDRDDFTISTGGVLRFAAEPNFEAPTDSGGNNDYRLTVVASDGPNTVRRNVTVTVENVEEPGAVSLSSQQPQVETELTATLTDPDGGISLLSWTWERSQNQADWTAIDGATSRRYTPDTGDLNHYLRATASYTDGHGAGKSAQESSDHQVRAKPVQNSPPDFGADNAEREIAENSVATEPVGAPVAATDANNDSLAYTLSAGHRDTFTVDGDTGQIRVKEDAVLDHEARSRYSVTVTATDPSNASDRIVVAITVTDVNEPPRATADTATTARDTAVVIRGARHRRRPRRPRPDRIVALRSSPRLRGSGSRPIVHVHAQSRLHRRRYVELPGVRRRPRVRDGDGHRHCSGRGSAATTAATFVSATTTAVVARRRRWWIARTFRSFRSAGAGRATGRHQRHHGRHRGRTARESPPAPAPRHAGRLPRAGHRRNLRRRVDRGGSRRHSRPDPGPDLPRRPA